jgi:hypothetical protein
MIPAIALQFTLEPLGKILASGGPLLAMLPLLSIVNNVPRGLLKKLDTCFLQSTPQLRTKPCLSLLGAVQCYRVVGKNARPNTSSVALATGIN